VTAAVGDPVRARLIGVASLCAGVAIFSLQDVIVKWLAGDYPIHEIMVIRSLVAMPLLLAFVRFESGWSALRTRRLGMLLARGAILLVCYTTYYLAVPALPLATVVSISFSSPLFIAALAGPVLGERVGPGRWCAIAVGFAGVLVVARPSGGALEPAALLAVSSALAYAVGQVLSRRLGVTETSSVMAFFQNGMFIAGGAVMAVTLGGGWFTGGGHPSVEFLVRPWVMPTPGDALILVAGGFVAGTGAWCLTHAYRVSEVNVVAPFEYTALVWAAAWGFLIWGEVPGVATLAGIALVLGASLYVLRARVS
jgi:drug/metabolite transporter (DMT)-like permease